MWPFVYEAETTPQWLASVEVWQTPIAWRKAPAAPESARPLSQAVTLSRVPSPSSSQLLPGMSYWVAFFHALGATVDRLRRAGVGGRAVAQVAEATARPAAVADGATSDSSLLTSARSRGAGGGARSKAAGGGLEEHETDECERKEVGALGRTRMPRELLERAVLRHGLQPVTRPIRGVGRWVVRVGATENTPAAADELRRVARLFALGMGPAAPKVVTQPGYAALLRARSTRPSACLAKRPSPPRVNRLVGSARASRRSVCAGNRRRRAGSPSRVFITKGPCWHDRLADGAPLEEGRTRLSASPPFSSGTSTWLRMSTPACDPTVLAPTRSEEPRKK